MNWAALFGGLIGATIPGTLAYLGIRRSRQATDAETFGPAMLVLHRMQPDRIMFNINNDPSAEATRLHNLDELTHAARERLLVISAGHPRRRIRTLADTAQTQLADVYGAMNWQVEDMLRDRDNPEWVEHYRQTHAEAETTMRALIAANFAWRPRRQSNR
jgi:hypothetical protein